MEHLVIITPKEGAFVDYLLRFPHVYKFNTASATYAYFIYIGPLSPKQQVLKILSIYNFKEFSLDKETNFYRFKVYVE